MFIYLHILSYYNINYWYLNETSVRLAIYIISRVVSGVCVTCSLVLCVCFVDRCLSFRPFSFGHYVVCSSPLCCLFFSIVLSVTPLVTSNSSYITTSLFFQRYIARE